MVYYKTRCAIVGTEEYIIIQ